MLRRLVLLIAALLPLGRRVAAAEGQAVRDMVLDPGARFSVRAVLGELDGIEPLTAPDSAERGRVMQLHSFVENKGERSEDSIRHGEEALRIEATRPFLDLGDKVSLHHAIARQAEEAGYCEAAVPHYRAVLPLMEQEGASRSSQLGPRQRLAFCLHGTRHFAEARQINESILADAATLFPPDDPRTFTAPTNLAQNEYELGALAAARATLESLLADALKARDAEVTDRSLFQLGVLAFEGGRSAEALDLMQRRLSPAQASGDPGRIVAAEDALDVLHDNQSGAGAGR